MCVFACMCMHVCIVCLHTFVPTPKEQVPLLQSTRSSSFSGFFVLVVCAPLAIELLWAK